MLAQARKLIHIDRLLKSGTVEVEDSGQIAKMQEEFQGFELGHQTVGIIGLGQIGHRVAERLQGFGSRIIYYDPYVAFEKVKTLRVESVDLETLLRTADIVTLHIQTTPETFRMIGKEQLSWMKPTAHLINTA